MKKAFSFMEVIISTALLSVVMLVILQIKSDNIFLVSKAQESKDLRDYLTIASNINEVDNKNETLFLDRNYSIDDDTIRRELKRVKVKIKDDKLNSLNIEDEQINLSITSYSRSYSINDDIKKTIYSFKLEL